MIRRLLIVWLALAAGLGAGELKKFAGCELVPTAWSDGDSFAVRLPDGSQQTVRLYGADTIEIHVKSDESNARRLREQQRYFGIADITAAKAAGDAAAAESARLLARPFTLYTAFSDARGDSRYRRIYGFIETADGRDLSEHLVSQGFARAFGVSRQRADGTSGKEWRDHLADLELTAARAGRGAWAKTDWEKLPILRKQSRDESSELEKVRGTEPARENAPVDLNRASRDELMSLPGIGGKTADAIIKARPYRQVADLDRAAGVGPATVAKLKDLVSVGTP